MPTEDAEKVLEFFEKNWNKFAVNTKPKVVIVSQGYDDNMVKKEIEFCEMLNNYDTSFVWGAYNSGGIMQKHQKPLMLPMLNLLICLK